MNLKAFQNLILALQEHPAPDKFTMEYYGLCGTPACCLGTYASRQDLQSYFGVLYDSLGKCYVTAKIRSICLSPDSYRVFSHFDITQEEAWELFSPDGCNEAQTISEAIAYIQDFILRHQEPQE